MPAQLSQPFPAPEPVAATPDNPVPTYADVIVPRQLHRPFTYLVPPSLRTHVHVGSQVVIPFGARTLRGTIVALAPALPAGEVAPAMHRLRPILSVVPDEETPTSLTSERLAVAQALADRYLAPLGACARLVSPPSSDRIPALRYRLASAISGFPRRLSPTARAVLQRLADARKGLSPATLKRGIKGPLEQTLRLLERRGLVRAEAATASRRMTPRPGPASQQAVSAAAVDAATTAQWSTPSERPGWWPRFRESLRVAQSEVFLLSSPLHTRMACLVAAVTEALGRGQSALVLVPDLSRATLIAALGQAQWKARVELWHGSLSPTQRGGLWRTLASGPAAVVVGTRSAVFAPLSRLGLVWVDEEEDAAFKEEQVPRYHARDVAWLRARHQGAALILASAHPSLETRHRFAAMPDHTAAAMRPASSDRPNIQLVDMRQAPHGLLLSEALLAGLSAALDRQAGAIVLLNRKGFAPVLLCQDCGGSPRCQRCSVALAFYRRTGRLLCSQCGTVYPLPDTCVECLAPRLEPIGFGTERLQEELERLFRGARIARLDADTARTAEQRDGLRRQLADGHLDMLVATQMVLEGPPLPPVGFVGLPHADAGLHIPDFRAAERLYHTLLDAVELARPAAAGGRAVLQTYLPSHHVIQAVVTASSDLFEETELRFRHALGYPPFSHLIALRVSGADPRQTEAAANRWAELLTPIGSTQTNLTVLGPAPAYVAQRRGRHRWQLLVMSPDAEQARECVCASLARLERTGGRGSVRFEVDVDPVEML